ncbi:hypothetical protein ACG02S_23545 [Roseateles sp. DC23W]|uniref:SGNH hydrolase-type esterase domain-containing protein n=1 Tax=Pelomonas dachongensis TaxID=3299029 RepID=A0ABW7ETN5_9BURK
MFVDQGLGVGDFKYIFLAEGDSWMERSAVLQGSLPDFFGYYMDSLHDPVLIINLAMFGDELRRIGTVQRKEFKYWLRQFKYDAVLFSAGGNDYIDAAKNPDPGKGILHSYVGGGAPTDAKSCINWAAVGELRTEYLTKCFKAIYDMVQQSQNKGIPILVNSYEVPVARNAPAVKEAWLYNAYVKNNIPPVLWPEVTKEIFGSISEELLSWTDKRPSVSLVPTRGVLTPAVPGSTGNSGDWVNEIHPNRDGWEKLAPIWKKAFDKARGLPV